MIKRIGKFFKNMEEVIGIIIFMLMIFIILIPWIIGIITVIQVTWYVMVCVILIAAGLFVGYNWIKSVINTL
jgi:hypothetical protein